MGLTLLFLATLHLAADDGARADFRNTRWEMNKAEVREVESSRFLREPDSDTLVFEDEVFGINFEIRYNFIENRLHSSMYLRHYDLKVGQYDQLLEVFPSYLRLKDGLTTKYGSPSNDWLEVKDVAIWRNGKWLERKQAKDGKLKEYDDFATYPFTGGATFRTAWLTKRTQIVLFYGRLRKKRTRDPLGCSLAILYESYNNAELRKKRDTEKQKKDLEKL